MKDTNIKIPNLKGIYENYPQPSDALQELNNWVVDPYTGGWSTKIGFEKYASNRNDWQPFIANEPIYSMFYVQRHQGAQDSIIFECAGTLYHLNDFAGSLELYPLSENRITPSTSELNTQYAQYGSFVLYVNGYDRPAKSHLYPVTDVTSYNYLIEYPLGFTHAPSPPIVWQIETDPTATGTAGDKASIWFTHNNLKDKGLGIPESGKENQYKYKVTFVNNAGAESPISSASSTVSWTTPTAKYRYAIVMELPTGEVGTVARRVYRTKNFSADSSFDADTYYFVAEIANNSETFYIDDNPDGALGAISPTDQDSVTMPSLHCRYMGIYKDCLFIDGGRDNDTTVYFSNPTKFDQFQALSFLNLGNRQGGGLTGLFGYFNFCLAFRENSIDVIRGDFPNFIATPLVQHIGTRATNTICAVPEIGVVFLGRDGLYAVSGNPEYGSTPSVTKITPHLDDTFARMNVDSMHLACAVYSPKRREYQVFFPVDGETRNNLGLVWHTDKKTFSIREEFAVGSLVKNADGDVFFGYNNPLIDQQYGIMVQSYARAAGQEIINDNMYWRPPVNSVMRSAWLDFGDQTMKKKVHSVYLFIATGGDQDITMTYFTDFNYNDPKRATVVKAQRPDFNDQSVYNKVQLDKGLYWEEPLVTTVRIDVHSGACSHFQWLLETKADLCIIGYAIDFTANGSRVIKGKRL